MEDLRNLLAHLLERTPPTVNSLRSNSLMLIDLDHKSSAEKNTLSTSHCEDH